MKIQEYLTSILARVSSSGFDCTGLLLVRAKCKIICHIVGCKVLFWTVLMWCSCYQTPDASLASVAVLVSTPWLTHLSSGILRTTGGRRSLLASPSGRQGRRGIIRIPLLLTVE